MRSMVVRKRVFLIRPVQGNKIEWSDCDHVKLLRCKSKYFEIDLNASALERRNRRAKRRNGGVKRAKRGNYRSRQEGKVEGDTFHRSDSVRSPGREH